MRYLMLLGLLACLSACAPAVLGSTINNPIQVESGIATEKIFSGQTWYIGDYYNPESFGYTLSDRNTLLKDTLSTIIMGQKGRRNVTRDFRFNAVNIPEGWQVNLQSSYLQREIVDVDGDSYSYTDELYFVFAVTIPEGVRGARLLTLSVGKAGKTKSIQINVRVANP